MNHVPCAIASVINIPGTTLTDPQRTVSGTLPANAAAAGNANHGSVALDLAYAAGHTCLVGFEGTFSGVTRRLL
jgi:hypothetical protein